MARTQWRNGEHGYGAVTKVLHWLIAVAIAAQFAVGYLLDAGGRGRGRGRGRSGESGRGRGRGGDYELFGLHVATHVAFFVAIVLHVGVVLKHQVVDRDRLLRRMLPARSVR